MWKRFAVAMAMAAMLMLAASCGASNNGLQEDEEMIDEGGVYFPAKTWRATSPEEQGIDSAKLVEMLEAIRRTNAPVHSVLIIRHGTLVMEAYMHPFDRNTRNDLFSATKSFTSTLVGIAIDEGKIGGVGEKVLSYFPDVNPPANSLGTADMTIGHALTMTAGHAADSVDGVQGSANWPRDFFAQPFSAAPGQAYLYDSGASHLLSAVIGKATGKSADQYAREKLFKPLGITDYSWETSREGISTGGWGIRMTAADMARFGYLILNNGSWNGKRLVSADWIAQATSKHVDSDWNGTKGDGYGYQWWMNSFGGFRADGFAGQCIYVLPELDMVAVITAGMNGTEEYRPGKLMEDFVVPAARPSASLPANEAANGRLRAILDEMANPVPSSVSPLPETAIRISQQKFLSPGVFHEFSLDFSKQGECTMRLTQAGRSFTLPVGLDGVHRITKASRVGTLQWYPPYQAVALKGQWTNDNTFVIDWQYVGEPYRETFTFVFEAESTVMEISEYVVGCAGPMKPFARYTCGKVSD